MKKLLAFLLFCALAQFVLAQGTRIKLTQLEKGLVASTPTRGLVGITDNAGNQRYMVYVNVADNCITYTPTATGNTQNLNNFVQKCSTDSVWYIDFEGRSILLGRAGGSGVSDLDWLEIDNNQPPNNIRDSMYTYSYSSIGARMVWPGANFIVVDSTTSADQVIIGNRDARIALYNTLTGAWSSIGQSGAIAQTYAGPGTTSWRVTEASGANPTAPTTPFDEHMVIDFTNNNVQFNKYGNARRDAGTPNNVLGTTALGVLQSFAPEQLQPELVVDYSPGSPTIDPELYVTVDPNKGPFFARNLDGVNEIWQYDLENSIWVPYPLGGSSIAEPAGQVVYGTGSGVDSDARFKWVPSPSGSGIEIKARQTSTTNNPNANEVWTLYDPNPLAGNIPADKKFGRWYEYTLYDPDLNLLGDPADTVGDMVHIRGYNLGLGDNPKRASAWWQSEQDYNLPSVIAVGGRKSAIEEHFNVRDTLNRLQRLINMFSLYDGSWTGVSFQGNYTSWFRRNSQDLEYVWNFDANKFTIFDTTEIAIANSFPGRIFSKQEVGGLNPLNVVTQKSDNSFIIGDAKGIEVQDTLRLMFAGTQNGGTFTSLGVGTIQLGAAFKIKTTNDRMLSFEKVGIASPADWQIRVDPVDIWSLNRNASTPIFNVYKDAVSNLFTLRQDKVSIGQGFSIPSRLSVFQAADNQDGAIAIVNTARTRQWRQFIEGGLFKIRAASTNNSVPVVVYENTTAGNQLFVSNTSPESAITANPGDFALVNNAGTGEAYIKETGTGNTGWSKITTASSTAFLKRIGVFSNTATARGLSIVADSLKLHAASYTLPGAVSVGTQTFAGPKTFQQGAATVVTPVIASNIFDEDGQGVGYSWLNGGTTEATIIASNPVGALVRNFAINVNNGTTLEPFYEVNGTNQTATFNNAIAYELENSGTTTWQATGRVSHINITSSTTTLTLPEIVSGAPGTNQVAPGFTLVISNDSGATVTVNRSGTTDTIAGATSTTVANNAGIVLKAMTAEKWFVY